MTLSAAFVVVLAFQHAHTPGMESRGNIAMGFDQARATHHFVITPEGGEIRLTANETTDSKTVAEIRAHVRDIKTLFASGDFAKPEYIHGEMPPGARTMAEMNAEIAYRDEQTPSGATLVISSPNGAAVRAVHEYFRYQIREHQTGDTIKPEAIPITLPSSRAPVSPGLPAALLRASSRRFGRA